MIPQRVVTLLALNKSNSNSNSDSNSNFVRDINTGSPHCFLVTMYSGSDARFNSLGSASVGNHDEGQQCVVQRQLLFSFTSILSVCSAMINWTRPWQTYRRARPEARRLIRPYGVTALLLSIHQTALLHPELTTEDDLLAPARNMPAYAAMVTSTSTPASMLTMICLTISVGAFRLWTWVRNKDSQRRIQRDDNPRRRTQSDACGCASRSSPTSSNPRRKESCES